MKFFIFLLCLTSFMTFTLTIQHEQIKVKYDISINITTDASNCGGNCPSGGCDSCPCGMSKSYVDIKEWCSKYHWNQENCECIMKSESEGNANAVHQNWDRSYDVGLWQIDSVNWKACDRGNTPCDPTENLNCAKDIYGWGGNTWKLWATCGKCNACNSP